MYIYQLTELDPAQHKLSPYLIVKTDILQKPCWYIIEKYFPHLAHPIRWNFGLDQEWIGIRTLELTYQTNTLFFQVHKFLYITMFRMQNQELKGKIRVYNRGRLSAFEEHGQGIKTDLKQYGGKKDFTKKEMPTRLNVLLEENSQQFSL